MRFIGVLVALILGVSSAFAADVAPSIPQTFKVPLDRDGNPIDGSLPPCQSLSMGSLTITDNTAVKQITWPAGTTHVLIYPPSPASNIAYVSCNATTYVPATSEPNPVLRTVQTKCNYAAMQFLGVGSDTVGTVVHWCALQKN